MLRLPDPTPGPFYDRHGRPMYVPKDSRGVRLRVGQHVAFNYSGTLATGMIVYVGAAIQIDRDKEFQSKYNASTISRVRNKASILVLEEAP